MTPCQGRRRSNGALLGICITCDAQDSRARLETIPARVDPAWLTWVCDARVYTPQLGIAHSDSASRLNSADSESSTRLSSALTAAAAHS